MQQHASSGAENSHPDHRDVNSGKTGQDATRNANSGKTGQDATRNAQVVSVAQPMGVPRQQAQPQLASPSGTGPGGTTAAAAAAAAAPAAICVRRHPTLP